MAGWSVMSAGHAAIGLNDVPVPIAALKRKLEQIPKLNWRAPIGHDADLAI